MDCKSVDQISADLYKELPGLKGFSCGILKKIRLFAEAYSGHLIIGSTPLLRTLVFFKLASPQIKLKLGVTSFVGNFYKRQR
jgi:hypothetical protein